MVSGESERFVTRVRRVSARARRVETKPLDVSVGRVYSQTVGAVRWGLGRREPTRYLARGAESDGARARRTRHRGHGRSSSYGAAADEPGTLGVRAPTSNSKRAFFTRAFQRQSHVSNRANRQDFARLPLAEEIARIYLSTTNPNDAQSSRQSST